MKRFLILASCRFLNLFVATTERLSLRCTESGVAVAATGLYRREFSYIPFNGRVKRLERFLGLKAA